MCRPQPLPLSIKSLFPSTWKSSLYCPNLNKGSKSFFFHFEIMAQTRSTFLHQVDIYNSIQQVNFYNPNSSN